MKRSERISWRGIGMLYANSCIFPFVPDSYSCLSSVAALKCRQRKKQWLANLQAKVELFTTENDALTATVTQLREEIVNLKTLLLAHKDCPVSQAQGLGPLIMNGMSAGFDPHPYNLAGTMGMPPGAPMPQAIRR
jgi:ATF/CREB family transcription factor